MEQCPAAAASVKGGKLHLLNRFLMLLFNDKWTYYFELHFTEINDQSERRKEKIDFWGENSTALYFTLPYQTSHTEWCYWYDFFGVFIRKLKVQKR